MLICLFQTQYFNLQYTLPSRKMHYPIFCQLFALIWNGCLCSLCTYSKNMCTLTFTGPVLAWSVVLARSIVLWSNVPFVPAQILTCLCLCLMANWRPVVLWHRLHVATGLPVWVDFLELSIVIFVLSSGWLTVSYFYLIGLPVLDDFVWLMSCLFVVRSKGEVEHWLM